MARRRLSPARPAAPETKTALPPGGLGPGAVLAEAPRPATGPPIAQVSGQSAEAAALREVTAGLEEARATGRMVLDVSLAEIAADHLVRDRVAVAAEEIEALKTSIRTHGQRTPAEITPLGDVPTGRGHDAPAVSDGDAPPVRWGLISGWRRLRALAELHAETGEARFATLRALVRPAGEAAESYVAMVEENEVRLGLSYYERARVVAETAARGVFPDQSAALRTLFATASRAKRSKIASFIDLHEELGDLLTHPAAIPERLGLALVGRLRAGGRTKMRAALREARPADAEAELALLEKLARKPEPGQRASVSRAKRTSERLAEGVEMRLKEGPDGVNEVTLIGPGVDAALVARLRAVLG